MNEIKELTMRNAFPLEYFKSIRFRLEYPKKVSGNLVYIREHYDGYDAKKGDNIDSALKSFLESSFGRVSSGYETILIVEEQLQDALKLLKEEFKKMWFSILCPAQLTNCLKNTNMREE